MFGTGSTVEIGYTTPGGADDERDYHRARHAGSDFGRSAKSAATSPNASRVRSGSAENRKRRMTQIWSVEMFGRRRYTMLAGARSAIAREREPHAPAEEQSRTNSAAAMIAAATVIGPEVPAHPLH